MLAPVSRVLFLVLSGAPLVAFVVGRASMVGLEIVGGGLVELRELGCDERMFCGVGSGLESAMLSV